MARRPDPPKMPRAVTRDATGIRVAFDANYDGGSPILEYRLLMSYDTRLRYWVDGTRDHYVSSLSPKTPYYFWGQVRNAYGWSDVGPRLSTSTIGIPDIPNPPWVYALGVSTAAGSVRLPFTWDGGSPILEWQIGYGLDPNAPQSFLAGSSFVRNDFLPGRQYYFWIRTRNAAGWSRWSGRTSVLFPAGAFVKQNGVWKRALIWVRVNGVWKVAQPRVRMSGTWRLPRA